MSTNINGRTLYAGHNEFYRWGGKAQSKIEAGRKVNSNGYYSIPVYGGKYYQIGTSEGKYGEYAKMGNTFFSVNSRGYRWCKKGSPKESAYLQGLRALLGQMNHERGEDDDE